MKTQVFQAHTMASAVAQVKAHLGPEALILRTRSVRSGGVFSRRKLVEITAAAEP
ncbi:MAG: flagellar biosynthesis protein FlhF, partial [Actinobacteria bacterium]|nr:flagellar biosynthesis protein FlhF [Actinomycetota bacterium]